MQKFTNVDFVTYKSSRFELIRKNCMLQMWLGEPSERATSERAKEIGFASEPSLDGGSLVARLALMELS